jgi:putative hemolysin
MKSLFALTAAAATLALAGCTEPYPNDPTNLANPAATLCVDKGNQYEVREDAAGNAVGYCILTDGQEVDAWEYFRTQAT